jgi:glycosyltransferase involved in cell wall biosynthesis
MVAANYGRPSRKCFGEALMAFSVFQKRHPDSLLYLFTAAERRDGENINAMIDSFKIKAQFFDQYGLLLGAPNAVVARALNAFDVLLNPSRGEGFGCTLAEAQACGTPCITTDFSSMPEVAPPQVGNWIVGGQEYWNPEFYSVQKTPYIGELIQALEEAYSDSSRQKLERRNAVQEWAYSEYEADHVTEKFLIPALEQFAA